MQQKIYKGQLSALELAGYLVRHFDPLPNVQAQQVGKEEVYIVQIGQGDVIEKIHQAISITITTNEADPGGLIVTMGTQRWITPTMLGGAALGGLMALLVTPWALFMLLWPLRDAIAGMGLPEEIWNRVELGVASQGGVLVEDRTLKHPHEE
jgi:hypothetical protein